MQEGLALKILVWKISNISKEKTVQRIPMCTSLNFRNYQLTHGQSYFICFPSILSTLPTQIILKEVLNFSLSYNTSV